jgi:hypothetical protein
LVVNGSQEKKQAIMERMVFSQAIAQVNGTMVYGIRRSIHQDEPKQKPIQKTKAMFDESDTKKGGICMDMKIGK